MARLYSNENFPIPVVEELRRLGHDVLTIQETGKANQEYPDDGVLNLAIAANRAVLTVNRKDFRKLHREVPDHKGIIICTADNDFVGQAQRIHDTIEGYENMDGELIRVNRPLR